MEEHRRQSDNKSWLRRSFTIEGLVAIGTVICASIAFLWAINSKYCALVYADQAQQKDICVLKQDFETFKEERKEERRMLEAIYRRVVR